MALTATAIVRRRAFGDGSGSGHWGLGDWGFGAEGVGADQDSYDRSE